MVAGSSTNPGLERLPAFKKRKASTPPQSPQQPIPISPTADAFTALSTPESPEPHTFGIDSSQTTYNHNLQAAVDCLATDTALLPYFARTAANKPAAAPIRAAVQERFNAEADIAKRRFMRELKHAHGQSRREIDMISQRSTWPGILVLVWDNHTLPHHHNTATCAPGGSYPSTSGPSRNLPASYDERLHASQLPGDASGSSDSSDDEADGYNQYMSVLRRVGPFEFEKVAITSAITRTTCTHVRAHTPPCTPAPLHPCTLAPLHPCTRTRAHREGNSALGPGWYYDLIRHWSVSAS